MIEYKMKIQASTTVIDHSYSHIFYTLYLKQEMTSIQGYSFLSNPVAIDNVYIVWL